VIGGRLGSTRKARGLLSVMAFILVANEWGVPRFLAGEICEAGLTGSVCTFLHNGNRAVQRHRPDCG